MDKEPKPKVLVVDDEPATLESLCAVLELDFDPVCVTSAEAAIEVLQKQPVEVALVDINLPDIFGLDLLPMMKETRPETEVIMVTGVAELEVAEMCLDRGAFDYLTKPPIMEPFLSTLRKAIKKHRETMKAKTDGDDLKLTA